MWRQHIGHQSCEVCQSSPFTPENSASRDKFGYKSGLSLLILHTLNAESDTFRDSSSSSSSSVHIYNHDLALANTLFSTPKIGVSHTSDGRGRKRIKYNLTRQRDRKLVRNVQVHPQPSFPFRTIRICPHPSSSSVVLLKTTGLGPQLSHQRTVGAWRLIPNFDRRWPQRLEGPSGQTRQETAMWTTWKPHSPQASCRQLKWRFHPRNEGDQGEVGVETSKRKLSCRLRLIRCTQRGSA